MYANFLVFPLDFEFNFVFFLFLGHPNAIIGGMAIASCGLVSTLPSEGIGAGDTRRKSSIIMPKATNYLDSHMQ